MILDVIEPMIDWSELVHVRTFMAQVVTFGLDDGCPEVMREGRVRQVGDVCFVVMFLSVELNTIPLLK